MSYQNLLILLLFLILFSCQGQTDLHTLTGRTMGTSYTVKVVGDLTDDKKDQLQQGIDQILAKINQQMSTYQKDSELSKLNQFNEKTYYKISNDLYQVIEKSILINQETDGAFDVTVGPLVNLWGFGPDKKRDIPPDRKEIEKIQGNIGTNLIELHHHLSQIKKLRGDLYIDLSAIAKGYAVDKVSTYLKTKNLNDHMVEIGGEIRVAGYKAEDEKWSIAIEVPDPEKREIGKVIKVTNLSMATSGDYRNFFIYKGKRYSHTIDPRTGYPVTHDLTAVSVFMKSCMNADAIATGLMVMGPKKGMEFVNTNKIMAIFYLRTDQGFEEKISEAMKDLLNKN